MIRNVIIEEIRFSLTLITKLKVIGPWSSQYFNYYIK